ncbi:copper homeostasis protein CutC [Streptomyces boncukensis]|uniref:Copper homeostasis protein cutC homolog n=1 Tax=Streptomyces boncukensis TaxID=2711219 RepID=A0A6G4X7X0_9ACTN|nr:copper homeostasis protein CutC [Streptomyces boncukensis]NGO72844.1 copper homeostasis protein CutC [Streptomyces boncukensis]
MSRPLLEVIALSAEDAAAAQAGGADRLEVVGDIAADGLTPSRETFAAIRAACGIPLRVMLRLTDGFAAGDEADVASLRTRARQLRAEGAEEFVLGFLDDAGQPDMVAVAALAEELDGCRWTFHRAIDRAVDRPAARKQLAEVPGLDTYLTAGSPEGVAEGLPVLYEEAARTRSGEPGYGATMLVGGGLRLQHLAGLRDAGVGAFHIGGAARPGGWDGPVDVDAVRVWRGALDAGG